MSELPRHAEVFDSHILLENYRILQQLLLEFQGFAPYEANLRVSLGEMSSPATFCHDAKQFEVFTDERRNIIQAEGYTSLESIEIWDIMIKTDPVTTVASFQVWQNERAKITEFSSGSEGPAPTPPSN